MTPEVGALLALAMWPDPERIRATLEGYLAHPERQVWAWQVDGRPVCAAGVRREGSHAEVLHLGTRADARGRGHARCLLLTLTDRLCLTRLEAETDDGAVAFYRRAGFAVTPRAPRGGHARYHCILAEPLPWR